MQIQYFDIEKITGNIDAIVRGDIEPLRKLKRNEKWMTNSIIPPNFVNDNRTRRCDTMAQDVLCEVNNCKFWANGNKCSAEAIYVVSHKGKHASTTEETDCKTFDPEV